MLISEVSDPLVNKQRFPACAINDGVTADFSQHEILKNLINRSCHRNNVKAHKTFSAKFQDDTLSCMSEGCTGILPVKKSIQYEPLTLNVVKLHTVIYGYI
ncbi:hypothetical protein D3C76_1070880 [compost metagenome]